MKFKQLKPGDIFFNITQNKIQVRGFYDRIAKAYYCKEILPFTNIRTYAYENDDVLYLASGSKPKTVYLVNKEFLQFVYKYEKFLEKELFYEVGLYIEANQGYRIFLCHNENFGLALPTDLSMMEETCITENIIRFPIIFNNRKVL